MGLLARHHTATDGRLALSGITGVLSPIKPKVKGSRVWIKGLGTQASRFEGSSRVYMLLPPIVYGFRFRTYKQRDRLLRVLIFVWVGSLNGFWFMLRKMLNRPWLK